MRASIVRWMPRQAIFILTDTQSTDMIGCYGRPEMKTPRLDQMATSGIRFDRAYTTQPVCGPARSALFTGLYPHSNGVLGNDMAPSLDTKTIGQRLSDAGIKTGYVGKWHLDGTDYFGNGICPEGWDPKYWFDGRCYLQSLSNQEEIEFSRLIPTADSMRAGGYDEKITMGHRSVNRAIEFIREHKDEDFFLTVSIDEPHHPFICPAEFLEEFEGFEFQLGENAFDELEDKPQVQRDWARHMNRYENPQSHHRNDAFYACNSYCDYEIGRVLDAIEENVPEALAIYTSDHGDMLGAHRITGKGPAMYEEVAKIPFLVRWKGSSLQGATIDRPVSHVDLVPTFLEYFDRDRPEILQGESLLSVLRHPAECQREVAFIEFNRFEVDHDGFGAYSPIRCIVTDRYKLAINLLDKDEFYDLEKDPGEIINRIDDPETLEIREALHDRIIAWMYETRDPMRGPHWLSRQWRKEEGSTWGGSTRPRPADGYNPHTLLYDTAEKIDRLEYDKA